ncbi:hypothetical protein CRUP_037269, partial [Coryphaenoides rupestris]
TRPTSAVDIHAPAEVVVENGTTGVLKCFFKSKEVIFYLSSGKVYPVTAFQDRLQFIGDLNKKDASIQLLHAQFSDNGTYFCDVKNPPDNNTAVIVGAVCGAVIGVVLIAVVTYLIIQRHQSRNDYRGCISVESTSSHAPRPRKKAESIVEGSVGGRPSGSVQGPVIYAQLDHSSIQSPNSYQKTEPIVYADIRKN